MYLCTLRINERCGKVGVQIHLLCRFLDKGCSFIFDAISKCTVVGIITIFKRYLIVKNEALLLIVLGWHILV